MSFPFYDINDLKLCTEKFFPIIYNSISRFFGLYQCCVCNCYLSTFCDTCRRKTLYATPECSLCRKFSENGSVHHICLTNALSYTYTFSLYSYTKEVKSLFAAYKYDEAFQYQRSIEELVDEYFQVDPFLLLKKWQRLFHNKRVLLLPVPMTKRKQNERGFSPAYELSIIFGRKLQEKFHSTVVLCTHLLKKVVDSKAQAKKKREQRLLSLSKSYQLVHDAVPNLCDQNFAVICVVDDILTTGATTTVILDQCATNEQLKRYLKSIPFFRFTFASA